MTPLLQVTDLWVAFQVKRRLLWAVRGISFSVGKREILGVVGESGCGKSAAAKALVRLLPEQTTRISGSALYRECDLLSLSKTSIQKIRGGEIGMIFQDPMTSLNPTMTIGDQVVEGYLHHDETATKKQARAYAIHLLDLVGIPHATSRFGEYPHTLSGGMRQRVMIALALAPKPKLIIADEPTTALDVTIQAQILDLMHQIKEKMGTSFLLITHDMSTVAGYCDNVLVMYAGKIAEQAPTHHLFDQPSHPYTQGLLRSIPRLDMPSDHPLLPILGSPPSPTDTIKGCAFYNRCSYARSICKESPPPLKYRNQSHTYACWKDDNTSS